MINRGQYPSHVARVSTFRESQWSAFQVFRDPCLNASSNFRCILSLPSIQRRLSVPHKWLFTWIHDATFDQFALIDRVIIAEILDAQMLHQLLDIALIYVFIQKLGHFHDGGWQILEEEEVIYQHTVHFRSRWMDDLIPCSCLHRTWRARLVRDDVPILLWCVPNTETRQLPNKTEITLSPTRIGRCP